MSPEENRLLMMLMVLQHHLLLKRKIPFLPGTEFSAICMTVSLNLLISDGLNSHNIRGENLFEIADST